MTTELEEFCYWLLDRDIHGEDNGNRMTINLEIEVDQCDSVEGMVRAVVEEYRRSMQ
jgi:hypothetical protein